MATEGDPPDGASEPDLKEEDRRSTSALDGGYRYRYRDSDDDGGFSDYGYSDDDEEGDAGERSGGDGSDLRQHLTAAIVAAVAAALAHAGVHGGGYGAWRDELARDWAAIVGGRGPAESPSGDPRRSAAAPSMDGIPAPERRRALERSLGAVRDGGRVGGGGGHARARGHRRTGGLSFCPNNGSTDASSRNEVGNGDDLAEMEFILPLEPGVRVLHSHYLADAFRSDSSMVYEDYVGGDLGSYGSDLIINEIDGLIDAGGDEALMLDQVESVVESHLLPKSLRADREHVCLLHQYALNRATGRSIRGTTMSYDRPHVSSFYRAGGNKKIAPASLTFTGYAAKFVNLSPRSLNLYWDGGQREGEAVIRLVGSILPMESLGTSSHPGHTFYLTPTYDKGHVLTRWTVTEDEPVLYYDPISDLATEEERMREEGRLTESQRFKRDAWAVDRSFGRDYLIRTGRAWLANFPQPHLHWGGEGEKRGEERRMHMWPAEYIDQTHEVNTSSLYYHTLPERLGRLTADDYLPEAEARRQSETRRFRSISLGKKKDGDAHEMTTMSLALKVLSCAPRVLEARRFLSPTEVRHLIRLASESEGGVRGWIHREQDELVDAIFRRVADLLNVDERLMRDQARGDSRVGEGPLPTHDRVVEAMQLVRRGPGERYPAHHDFAHPPMENRYQPRRHVTVLLHLTGEGDVADGVEDGTEVLRGGATVFPSAITSDFHDGARAEPRSGKAIVLYNVLPDGNLDDLAQHSGERVEGGVQYVANVWVWDPIVN